MELSLPSELGYEVVARDAVAAFARRQGFAPDRIEELKTALCEACINAIEHGNMLVPDLRVEILCSFDANVLLIDVIDEGRKHYVSNGSPLTIDEKVLGLGPLRGMGLMLIDELSDEAGFVKSEHRGNCFRLTFRLKARCMPEESF
jgi:serine/threonine-protein kinase RsbW